MPFPRLDLFLTVTAGLNIAQWTVRSYRATCILNSMSGRINSREDVVARYIEGLFNPVRQYPTLGFQSHIAFE